MARGLGRAARRFARDDRGSMTIEFLIMFPILLFFLFFILAVSYYLGTASDVQQAAQTLARSSIGVLSRDADADVCATLTSDILPDVIEQSPLLELENVVFAASCTDQPAEDGSVTISLTYDLAGSTLQAFGRNAGFSFTQITRSASIRM